MQVAEHVRTHIKIDIVVTMFTEYNRFEKLYPDNSIKAPVLELGIMQIRPLLGRCLSTMRLCSITAT